jgi:(E)-4-hydroxy-3-methyl-but-2-enyl pyrophosphate reductase
LKVRLAKTAGFCMGVRRAMELVLAEVNKGEDSPLCTFGPLIHNKQVLELLDSKGVKQLDRLEDLQNMGSGRIVIRAHGIPPRQRLSIKRTGLKIIDATCPRVARVQAIIRYYTKKDYMGIIVGDEDHAEVIGLKGYGKTPVHVIQTVSDLKDLEFSAQGLFVVAQTTQDEKNYREVVKAIRERKPDVLVFDTICDATHQRQEEVKSFAGQVGAVVVVGGYHSGNTRRLAQVARSEGLSTFHVETEKDLAQKKLAGMKVIGVTAGASTPNWIIQNVVREIEGLEGRKETLLGRVTRKGFKFLVLSNFFAATGAFALSYATTVLSNREQVIVYPLLAFLYIYAMHVLNRFLDKGASAYNAPERAKFHQRYGPTLITLAIAAILVALFLAYSIGMKTFFALTGFTLLGIIYSLPLVPARFRHHYKYSKIKDIPGSKTLSETFAWVGVVAILPLFQSHHIVWPAEITAILYVISISYVRSALFGIFQIQGDLIAGPETLPMTLGEKKTWILLKITLMACAAILCVAPLLSFVGALSYLLLLSLLSLALCLMAYQNRWLHPGIALEALVEGNFFLAGLLALLWQAPGWHW